MAIMIKTAQEIEKMRISGKALRQVHNAIAPHVVPGASTMDLEEIAVKKIAELGAIAAFKGYHGFPAALCTSVNNEVVHGMPNAKRILAEGDILSIDCGVIIDGYYSDAAVTYPIGRVSAETTKLLEVTKSSLEKAIEKCQVGGRLGDISAAVQELCEAEGFGVVREFVGHGIGRAMHEDPQVPNFGAAGKGPRLKAGMVLAIEPMINAGGPEVRVLKDGWTAVTIDGSYSAHFEHTVAITKDGPQVLTR
ncbi:type I methionyl aminopeptidase [Tunturiibacter gelidoferens]|jgi:methionyl aminopeptidase|uniref:Methionine aminopeptidase n=1 Tax=Tunturiibacter gelidiferens TaxID=3069689 RepID=A0A9X0QDA3_9BACT|nr:type I methionyl aminopeptidase [Edaphobacter lichenicola]MBB5328263.1 methionyl aminopeptidase [Edaphobacter lichenicola]